MDALVALEQTFDAVRLTVKPIEDLTATYIFIDEVNRIFGRSSGLDFEADTHVFHAVYNGLAIGKIIGFVHLMDLGSTGTPGAAVSNQTYGLRLDGSVDLSEGLTLGYIGSAAYQADYGSNATNYEAIYLLAEGKLKFKNLAGGFVGGGIEVLGSDDGTFGFTTPLATGHKFNGLADSFLATPAAGLRDYYVVGGLTIPEVDVKVLAFFHYFTDDDTGMDLGTEFDLVMSKKLHKNLSVLLKFAHYDGDAGRADIQRFWLQLELNF